MVQVGFQVGFQVGHFDVVGCQVYWKNCSLVSLWFCQPCQCQWFGSKIILKMKVDCQILSLIFLPQVVQCVHCVQKVDFHDPCC